MPLPSPPGSQAFTRPSNATPSAAAALKFDDSQRAIIECPDKNIVANAAAGAGKTTTADGYARARPNAKFLYLCFGKANQLSAEARFGPNVECRTGHSLAYAAVGHKFKNQTSFNLKPRDFASQLRLPDVRMAAVILEILNQFFSSDNVNIVAAHIDVVADKWKLNANEYGPLLAHTKLAWSKMQQVGSGVSMTPDGYFKLWALSNPKLTKYTHIILDEAQDTNPVLYKIIEEQTHAHKLLIGDRHQSIFLFRGALNAMETFGASGATVLSMPKTWRFGPGIAQHANQVLSFFKDETVKIVGAGPASALRAENKRVVLSRTNAGLFDEAAAVMGKNVHWMGGIANYRVGDLLDSHFLKSGRRNDIRDAQMRGYSSWDQYVDEAEKTRDGKAKTLIKLNEQYGRDIPQLVRSFEDNALPTEAGARLVLATAHKGKGMEWDHVTLGDDFDVLDKAFDSLCLSPLEALNKEQAQEINLFYVAITRARHRLDMNKQSRDFLAQIDNRANELHELRAKAKPLQLNMETSSMLSPALA